MKQLTLILFCIITLYSCNQTENLKEPNVDLLRTEVDSLLSNWHKNAAESKLDRYFDFMDSSSIYIGTDATEIWTKKEFKRFCEPYFEKDKTWNFKALDRNIYFSRYYDLAWFDEVLTTHMGTCRGSGVLEKSNNNWKLKQYILSLAIPNNDMKAVIKLKNENDSIFIRNYKKEE